MKSPTRNLIIVWLSLTGLPCFVLAQPDTTYKIVDTGQIRSYDNNTQIPTPSPGQPFYGQDANYSGNTPSYTDNSDSTVTDSVTGLMWAKSPDLDGNGIINYNDKLYFSEALAYAASFNLAGYEDWRLPTIKELYSLIMFYGAEPGPDDTSTIGCIPFIDTSYFDFGYGDLSAGERLIDAQYATQTLYVGANEQMFGVNFADGRIKGYPASTQKKYYIKCVRDNSDYGANQFVDNGDGTITDSATGLMWMKDDNGVGIIWENALGYAEGFEYAGYTDWRLPNAKELHSIVDYTRSPASSNSAAIDPLFNCSQITNEAGQADYPYYWTGTTHVAANPPPGMPGEGVYIAFGRALGYMGQPGLGQWIDVHGAGAQRSDPKVGDPAQFPYGRGPQGDAVRIYNYVRLVRGGNATAAVPPAVRHPRAGLHINIGPNPANPVTVISFYLPFPQEVTLAVYNLLGEKVTTLTSGLQPPGEKSFLWDASEKASGVYIVRLDTPQQSFSEKLTIIK